VVESRARSGKAITGEAGAVGAGQCRYNWSNQVSTERANGGTRCGAGICMRGGGGRCGAR